MNGPDAAATFARDLLAALVGLGVRHAVISPGSRSTPLAAAAGSLSELTVTVVLDERSAGFTALGLAKATRDPVVTVCTSGSAAAHHHPAVVEARQARVPLIVMTADRPPELRGVGAPQTIDQTALYGTAVKMFHDCGVPDEAIVAAAPWLALRLFAAAVDLPPGPVHLNVPFREPLLGTAVGEAPAAPAHEPGVSQLQPEGAGALAAMLVGRRSIVVAGGRQRAGFGAAAALFGLETGIPVICDVQCRHPGPTTIAAGDLLAGAGFLDEERPEFVLRLGDLPTSKALWRWMEDSAVDQAWVDDGPWRDPLSAPAAAFRADPTATISALAASAGPAPEEWARTWAEAARVADDAAAAAIAAEDYPTEPGVARIVAGAVPEGEILYAGSSMPVRDLDSFSGRPRPITVLANRGANGIDGLLSAAAGASLGGSRVTCLTGDIGAIHDLNALVTIARDRLPVTIVVVNNDGGGIFDFLPQADLLDPAIFERLFATPHGVSLEPIAGALGITSRTIEGAGALETAVAAPGEGPLLVEVHTERGENVAVHRRIREAVAAALG